MVKKIKNNFLKIYCNMIHHNFSLVHFLYAVLRKILPRTHTCVDLLEMQNKITKEIYRVKGIIWKKYFKDLRLSKNKYQSKLVIVHFPSPKFLNFLLRDSALYNNNYELRVIFLFFSQKEWKDRKIMDNETNFLFSIHIWSWEKETFYFRNFI